MKATTTICTQDAGPTILAALTGPHAPRALLVSLDRRGQLQHQALEAGQSVVNLRTELFDHLNSAPQTDEYLLALRDYCDCRLAAKARAEATGGFMTPRPDGGWNITHTSVFEPLTVGGAL